MDDEGIDPDALQAACLRDKPKALYLNPTLLNPTTVTIPEKRREAIARIARRHRLPIIEDDAYGFIPQHGPPPFAAIAPDITGTSRASPSAWARASGSPTWSRRR